MLAREARHVSLHMWRVSGLRAPGPGVCVACLAPAGQRVVRGLSVWCVSGLRVVACVCPGRVCLGLCVCVWALACVWLCVGGVGKPVGVTPRGFPTPHQSVVAAASYSPTPSQVQYHRRCWA